MNPLPRHRARARLLPLGLALSLAIPALQAGEPPGDLTADLVLGQADFGFASFNRGSTPGANTLGGPEKIAIDRSVYPNRLYVADRDNNRVLSWNSTVALISGLPADVVFGQNGSFVTRDSVYDPTTPATLIGPTAVTVDQYGNLYVSSQQEARVLRYNAPFSADTSNGRGDVLADAAFGPPDLTTRAGNPDLAASVGNPYGISVDASDNLYVADLTGGRVLRFANASTAGSGTSATAVFGQSTLTGVGQNAGGLSASSLNYPWSAMVSATGDLYVTDWLNNRVLRYADAATAVTGAAAVGVFGQPDFTTATAGTTAGNLNGPQASGIDAAGNLWVADTGNNRVLRYDAAGLITTPGPAAAAVLGQAGSFTTNAALDAAGGLNRPTGVAFDAAGNVYIADQQNHRVVRYDGGSPGVPAPPTDLVATPGNASVSVSFTAPDGSISNYQYSINDGESYTAFSPADTSSPVTITGLSNGVEYAIRLRAVGTYGAGAPSAAVLATPISAVAGTCGAAHDVATASAPSAALCATGSAGAVTSSGGQWAWSCNGSGGSVINASCGAPFQSQTLSLSADPASIAVNGSSTVTASSSSGLAPALSLASSADCTLGVSSGSVTVTASVTAVNAGGSCVVQANRPISADGCTSCYQAAEETVTIALTRADQTISFGAAPTDLVVGGATGTVSATASSGLAVNFSNGLSMFCGVSGSTVTPLRAGLCTVLANQAGNANYNLAPQVSQDIVIGKGSQGITGFSANPVSLVVDGGTATLSASGGASGTAVTFSSTSAACSVSGSSVTPVAAGICTVAAHQAGSDDYDAAPDVTLNITVGKASQGINSFTVNPTSLVVGGGGGSLSATGGASGNAVTFSTTSSTCTISGSTVTPVAAGTCTVIASQAGNANYNAATAVSLDITVARGNQAITALASNPSTLVVGAGSGSLSASGGASGSPITYLSTTTGICTVIGNTVTPVAAGICTVVANQAGNASYNAATAATLNITVGAGSQVISGLASNPSSLVVGGSTGNLSAVGGGSGNPVTYASSTATICSVSGNVVTALSAGTCTVVANQAGNANYGAAPAVALNLTVTRGNQTIGGFVSNPSSLLVGSPSATLSASGGGSGNPVTYSTTTSSICTVSGSSVTAVAVGTCTVTASQAGTDGYNAAPSVSLDIRIGQGVQTISGFTTSASSLLVNRGVATLTASGGGSGNTVRFASLTPTVCTVEIDTVTAVAPGVCTISASQAGNAGYLAAVTQTLTISVSADSVEDTVPNSGNGGGLGDGNGDGIADSTQDEVASLPTLSGNSFATIVSASGRTLSRVATAAVPSDFPSGLRVPLAGVAFTLNQTGASETVDLYFPASDRVIGLRKRNRTTGVYDSLPVTVTRVGNRTRISFVLTDGGDYDADGVVNGAIVDPVFPEVAAASTSGGGSASWLSLLSLSLLAVVRRRRMRVTH